jgi:hypothetical protein
MAKLPYFRYATYQDPSLVNMAFSRASLGALVTYHNSSLVRTENRNATRQMCVSQTVGGSRAINNCDGAGKAVLPCATQAISVLVE